ncbi:MAG: GAF domain-containing protein [Deltaproteobacteria bacterium]|nr:GAF domain-containing protein [Deltaproteobacteria bacterium]
MGWILSISVTAASAVLQFVAAGEGADYFDEVTVTWDESETGMGPSGTAIRARRPDVCRNMAEDPRFAPWRKAAMQRGFASSAASPMIYGDHVLGVLNVHADRPDAFDEEEVGLLAEVAADLGFARQSIEEEAGRRRAEQELRESEERFRRLSEATFEGIAVHEKGVILEANEAFSRMFGYEPRDVIGMNALDFAAPESRDMVRQNILSGSEKSLTRPLVSERTARSSRASFAAGPSPAKAGRQGSRRCVTAPTKNAGKKRSRGRKKNWRCWFVSVRRRSSGRTGRSKRARTGTASSPKTPPMSSG